MWASVGMLQIRTSNLEQDIVIPHLWWPFLYKSQTEIFPSFQVTKDDFMTFDYILCMDENNLR